MTQNEAIAKLADYLKKAKRIAVLTGAGMSTESGVPDFRSSTGIYSKTSEEVFDIYRFRRNPSDFYTTIGPVYLAMIGAEPNAGHLALHELEMIEGKTVNIATQNIDGLHQRAGSTKVHEVHGTMMTLSCQSCGRQFNGFDFLENFKAGTVAKCPICRGVMKPDITFYGESLPEEAYMSSVKAFRQCDLAIVLGTSLKVYPAAGLPDYRPENVPLVIINRTETDADQFADIVINGGIGEILPAAIKQM